MDVDAIDRRLLNDYQRGFPLTPRPFARIADDLGMTESQVLDRLAVLQAEGKVGRIGAVVRPHTLGVSTLAAIAAPPEETDRLAACIAARPEVNHCYEREHAMTLWFVVTAGDGTALAETLAAIERDTGHAVLDLPLVQAYHIDLGFSL